MPHSRSNSPHVMSLQQRIALDDAKAERTFLPCTLLRSGCVFVPRIQKLTCQPSRSSRSYLPLPEHFPSRSSGSLAMLLAMRRALVHCQHFGNVSIGFCLSPINVRERLVVRKKGKCKRFVSIGNFV